MSEKDFYFLVIVGACIVGGLLITLFSKISDRRFEKKYFRNKKSSRSYNGYRK